MNEKPTPLTFRKNAARAVKDRSLRAAMRTSTDVFTLKRAQGLASVPVEQWRDQASGIRLDVLDHLPEYLDRFTAAATRAGAVIHRVRDAQTARETVFHLLNDRGAQKIVKSKSMVTEEIHLNSYLEKQGMEVVETDLGEYLVQIAGETPSHILAPAIHKTRQQIGRLFEQKLGVPYSDDPTVLTKIARSVLRQKFLAAQAGISGANFAIADTGSLVIFTNEGNGRMVTTLPRLHIAILTIEKMLPSLNDLCSFTRLLPRSASGQSLSSYVSVITGTRKPGEATGAGELHIVLLDNGRTEILSGQFREILKCIRCSACLNVCPVYRVAGGHAYGATYPGPMGIILTNLLDGIERAHPLADATTLCGACSDACPVRVPLVRLLRRLKEVKVQAGLTSRGERQGMAGFGKVVRSSTLFRWGQSTVGFFWPLLGMLGSSTVERLPRPAATTFRQKFSRES